MTQVVYISPDYEGEWMVDELINMPKDELITLARNTPNSDIYIYSLERFQYLFNNEHISDLGYIVFC